MSPTTIILSFFFGAIIGSFLSVVVYRTHKKQKIGFKSRSICPYCKQKLKARYLVPFFSYLLLGGKCGYCKTKISPNYFLIELFTATIFLLSFMKWTFIEIKPELNFHLDPLLLFLFHITVFSFLIAIFFYDLTYKLIPDRFSLPAIVIALIGSLLLKTMPPLEILLGGFGIFLFFAAQFYFSNGKWIGGGDLRLGAIIGFLLGWKLGIVALLLAYVLGSLFSIPLLLTKKINRKTQIAFGPFLITGTFISVFLGEKILNFYLMNLAI
ncbi:prepilin peptidase [Candidatus Peregrinibacteria bacterium]|nr:prepilin peptidase [Candidatus Peregrinibacteria bacterium]